MLDPVYSEPTPDEIVNRLEEVSMAYFKCNLDEFIRKLDANQLPEEKQVIADIMQSWLIGVPPDNAIFQSRRHQLSAAS
jgi:hypothetical protein